MGQSLRTARSGEFQQGEEGVMIIIIIIMHYHMYTSFTPVRPLIYLASAESD
jgi:hypothetical protein